MCRSRTNRGARLIAAALAAGGLGIWLAGCSDIYLDHRDSVGLSSGNAVAANEITQMVDPWPADWAPDWYQTDQLYVAYDNGYYLFDEQHPGEAVAIAVVM